MYLQVVQPITKDQRARLEFFENRYSGKRCFIVGNGPSLNKHDLSLLDGELTFGCNNIYYMTQRNGFKPTFYTVEDLRVMTENTQAIDAYDVAYKFFNPLYGQYLTKNKNIFFTSVDIGFYRQGHPFFAAPRFSRDMSDCLFAGQSVTYIMLQMAFYMGFTQVYLLGMDFYYEKLKSLRIKGYEWTSTEDDVNHFDPRYFGAGKKWMDPQLDKVALNYRLARKVFERNNRNIYNASIGGKLEVFERVDWHSLFADGAART